MDHGQRLARLDLVPAKGEGEAAGELFDAAVRLHVGAPADAPALLLLLQPQIQLRETEESQNWGLGATDMKEGRGGRENEKGGMRLKREG